MLEFNCPVCGSPYLEVVFRANRSVRTVYETSDNEDAEIPAQAALPYEQVREYVNQSDIAVPKVMGSPMRMAVPWRPSMNWSSG